MTAVVMGALILSTRPSSAAFPHPGRPARAEDAISTENHLHAKMPPIQVALPMRSVLRSAMCAGGLTLLRFLLSWCRAGSWLVQLQGIPSLESLPCTDHLSVAFSALFRWARQLYCTAAFVTCSAGPLG